MNARYALLFLALALVGCGSSGTQTYTDGKGNEVKVSGDGTKITGTDADGKTTTVETKDGDTTLKSSDGTSATMGTSPTEDELGLAYYPGSEEVAGQGMKAESPQEKNYMSLRTTADAPEKVIAFYTGKIKEPNVGSNQNPDGTMIVVSGKNEKGGVVTLAVSRSKSETKTTINMGISYKTK